MNLDAKARKKLGKLASLRAEGIVPAVVYGPKLESTPLELSRKQFHKVFKDAGYSKLVDLNFEDKHNKVLVREVQADIITGDYLHVSFYAVDMDSEIETEVPLTLTGESPAVRNSIGILTMPMDKVAIKCLPGDLPHEITVDISELKDIGDTILAGDLNIGEKVELGYWMSEDTVMVRIAAPQKEIVEEVEAETEELEGEEGESTESTEPTSETGGEEAKTE